MKTLCVHPIDPTTSFLSEIYQGKDWRVVREIQDAKQLLEEAKSYDRIIGLGHGFDEGLFAKSGMNFTKKAFSHGLAINSDWAPIMKTKQNVCIWCFASTWAKSYDVPGFFSGMFVSEVGEALLLGLEATEQEITESNYMFSKILGKNIFQENMYEKVLEEYNGNNPVVKYNRSLLCNR